MATYKYYIEEHGNNPENAIEFKSVHSPDSVRWIAEDAAGYGYSNNDLWEASWPLTFVILDEHDAELGRYTVECEAEPVFCARKVK